MRKGPALKHQPVFPRLAAEIAMTGAYKHSIASRAGIHPASLAKILAGQITPSDAVKERLATVLNVPASQLFVRREDM